MSASASILNQPALASVASASTEPDNQSKRPLPSKFVTDHDVEQGLTSSGQIHIELGKFIERVPVATKGSEAAAVSISLADLKRMRKLAAKANRAISKYARRSFETEDRLCLEIQLVRHAANRDRTDQAAHKARIFDRLRHIPCEKSSKDSHYAMIHDTSSSPLDRALTFYMKVDASLNDLSPFVPMPVGGQGMISITNTQQQKKPAKM